MKAITTGAVVLSLAAITGCAMHGSDDRYRHHDRSTSGQVDSRYDRTDGNYGAGTDSRHDGNWNSSDKATRDWHNRDQNSGAWNNRNRS